MRLQIAALAGFCVTSVFAQTTPPPPTPVPAPFTGYAGRFLDSALVRDFQIPSRTLRADMVKIAPEFDFIFVKAGGGVFAAYRLSTFPSKLGSPLTTLTPPRTPPFTEMYLDFDMSVDPQRPGSGWNAPQFDGQERLQDFDWDDRGYIYLAYELWGFGIVDRNGTLIKQVVSSDPNAPIPTRVFTFLEGGQHYLLVSSDFGQTSVIYNVNDPAAPQVVRTLNLGIMSYAKNASGDAIAIVDPGVSVLKIYTPAQLLNDGIPAEVPPNTTYSATTSFRFRSVTSDGMNFYATQDGSDMSKTNTIYSIVSTISPFPQGYASVEMEPITNVVMSDVEFRSGYLAVLGIGFTSPHFPFGWLYRADTGGTLTPFNITQYLITYQTAYKGMLVGPRQIVPFCTDAGSFAIFSMHGIGDVFSLTPGVAACPPHWPTDVVAIAGDGSATVSLTPPLNDGGAPITSYRVTSMPDAITATGASSPILVPGLTNNTTYTFTVVAMSSAGFSSPSAPSNAATPAATLLPPAIVTATASSASQVDISWSSAAGAATYKVLRSTGDSFTEIGTTSSLNFTDSDGLMANTTYLYAIKSIDSSEAPSLASEFDHATTTVFTDDSLTAGARVKAVHLSELHNAVNAMRVAAGLDPHTFVDPVADATAIAADDLTELRQALDDTRTTLHLPSPSYTDGPIMPVVTLLNRQHFQELRDAVK